MKQKFFIFAGLILIFLLLIGLNAATYVQKEKVPDSEDFPNRSTYNPGATGTRAFYDLLAETKRNVIRWQEPFPVSGKFDSSEFTTFVIIGKIRREVRKNELEHILNWVSAGGTLVLIDRDPPSDLLSSTTNWSVTNTLSKTTTLMIDPSVQSQMVGKTAAVKTSQPTIFTSQVNAVQPSKFASSIKITRFYNEADDAFETEQQTGQTTSEDEVYTDQNENAEVENADEPLTAPASDKSASDSPQIDETEELTGAATQSAPVIHLANEDTNLLADFPYGAGQIVFLSDPYIVSNGGINLVDNAKLGVNIVAAKPGIIAFDEYHQGYGGNENRLIEYFAETPVVPIFLQICLIGLLVFYSQSRRFARALPANEPNRLSKLEYVSAMAQLQNRTKAYDLAIENIYREFRRRVTRLVGIDTKTAARGEIAEKIAERTDFTAEEISELLYKCEDILHGEPATKKQIVELVSSLRTVEEALGLRRGKKRDL